MMQPWRSLKVMQQLRPIRMIWHEPLGLDYTTFWFSLVLGANYFVHDKAKS
jgi:hypothetical protein